MRITMPTQKYSDMEKALQELAANNNIFVGTVDYGDMLFFPKEIEKEPANRIPVEGFDKPNIPTVCTLR